jgi:hypothetical protein
MKRITKDLIEIHQYNGDGNLVFTGKTVVAQAVYKELRRAGMLAGLDRMVPETQDEITDPVDPDAVEIPLPGGGAGIVFDETIELLAKQNLDNVAMGIDYEMVEAGGFKITVDVPYTLEDQLFNTILTVNGTDVAVESTEVLGVGSGSIQFEHDMTLAITDKIDLRFDGLVTPVADILWEQNADEGVLAQSPIGYLEMTDGTAYFGSRDTDKLYKYPAGGTAWEEVTGGPSLPYMTDMFTDGQSLWVCDADANTVHRLNADGTWTDDGRAGTDRPIWDNPTAVAKEGEYFYILDRATKELWMRPDSTMIWEKVTGDDMPELQNPFDLAVNGDSIVIYDSNTRETHLRKPDGSWMTILSGEFNGAASQYRVAKHGDGFIVTQSASVNMWVFDVEGNVNALQTIGNGNPVAPAAILFMGTVGNNVYLTYGDNTIWKFDPGIVTHSQKIEAGTINIREIIGGIPDVPEVPYETTVVVPAKTDYTATPYFINEVIPDAGRYAFELRIPYTDLADQTFHTRLLSNGTEMKSVVTILDSTPATDEVVIQYVADMVLGDIIDVKVDGLVAPVVSAELPVTIRATDSNAIKLAGAYLDNGEFVGVDFEGSDFLSIADGSTTWNTTTLGDYFYGFATDGVRAWGITTNDDELYVYDGTTWQAAGLASLPASLLGKIAYAGDDKLVYFDRNVNKLQLIDVANDSVTDTVQPSHSLGEPTTIAVSPTHFAVACNFNSGLETVVFIDRTDGTTTEWTANPVKGTELLVTYNEVDGRFYMCASSNAETLYSSDGTAADAVTHTADLGTGGIGIKHNISTRANGNIVITGVEGIMEIDMTPLVGGGPSTEVLGEGTLHILEEFPLEAGPNQTIIPAMNTLADGQRGVDVEVLEDGNYKVGIEIPYNLTTQQFDIQITVDNSPILTYAEQIASQTEGTFVYEATVPLVAGDIVDVAFTGLVDTPDEYMELGLLTVELIPDGIESEGGLSEVPDLFFPRPQGTLLRYQGEFYRFEKDYDGSQGDIALVPNLTKLDVGTAIAGPHNPSKQYEPGDIVSQDGEIYFTTGIPQGPFDVADWEVLESGIHFDDITRFAMFGGKSQVGVVKGTVLDMTDSPKLLPEEPEDFDEEE